MELEDFSNLKDNPKNPRKISDHDFQALKRSIQQFGSLSGLVLNQRTGHLVGGHMRKRAFESMGGDKRIVITQRFDTPTPHGTVAVGYIEYEGERFEYRVVDWSEETETAAALVANRAQGQWDDDLLAENLYDLSQLENANDLLESTGFDENEINKFLESVSGDPLLVTEDEPKKEKQDDGFQRLKLKLTQDQYDTVYEAIAHMKHERQLTGEKNTELDSNAIYYICRTYLENVTSQNASETHETSTPSIDPSPTAETVTQTPGEQAPYYTAPYYTPEQTSSSTPDDLTAIPTL